jgi:hypothetical protein
MSFWTVATLILMLEDGSALPVLIPFRDEMSCGAALPVLLDAVRGDYPDSYATCTTTETLSGVSVRPVARPAN